MNLRQQVIAGIFLAACGSIAMAQTIVGVSWSNFQEERWKTDEAAVKGQLARIGGSYVSADADGSPAVRGPARGRARTDSPAPSGRRYGTQPGSSDACLIQLATSSSSSCSSSWMSR